MTSQRSKTGKLTATIALTAAVAVTVAILPTSAEAGPLRFLFGGGNGNNAHVMEDRVSRTPVPFVSQYEPGTIIVSFSDRRLYYVTGRGQALAYLIGTPAGDAKWSGTSYVSDKQVNPRWVPTPDMRAEDPTLPLEVAGGHPRNPLGVRALYLGDTLYRIHGTDAPWTVGQEVSHGCIRLFNSDIIDIYNRVPAGTPVVVTWESFTHVTRLAVPANRPEPRYANEAELRSRSATGWRTSIRH